MTPTRSQLISRVADRVGFALSQPQLQRLNRTIDALGGGDDLALLGRATPGTPSFDDLVESVLVGETYWFRDPDQLAAIVTHLAAAPPGRRRIWIAGCATGQEPHSLAILLHRAGVWPVEIIATDVSARAVHATAESRYPLARQRGLDAAVAGAYGSADEGVWTVAEELRRGITAVRHNILRDPPFPADVILCRNVLIYLTPEAVRTALQRFRQGLAEDGVLVLGHAETQLPGAAWRTQRRDGTFFFRPSGAAGDAASSDPPLNEGERSDGMRSGTERADRVREDRERAERVRAERARGSAAPRAIAPVAALVRAGETALDQGRPADAIGALRKARYLRADDPVPAVLLGIALARAGHPSEARRTWALTRRLLDRLPEDAHLVGGYPPAAVRQWVEQLDDREVG